MEQKRKRANFNEWFRTIVVGESREKGSEKWSLVLLKSSDFYRSKEILKYMKEGSDDELSRKEKMFAS